MNKLKFKVAGASALIMGLVPFVSHAQMSTTTANTLVASVISDVSQSMTTNITLILAVVAGLIALGWGYRKFKGKVGGRMF